MSYPTINTFIRKLKVLPNVAVCLIVLPIGSMVYCYCIANNRLQQEGEVVNSDQLNTATVTCFASDRDGTIWIGTLTGLCHYNGQNIEQYFYNENDTTTICSNVINDLCFDADGRLWIATDKGLSRYDGHNRFTRVYPSGQMSRVTKVALMQDSGMVCLSGNHIYIGTEQHFKPLAKLPTYVNSWIYNQYQISTDKNNCIWLLEPQSIRCYNRHGQCVKNFPNTYFPNANMCTIAEQGDSVWVAQSRYIVCVDKARKKLAYKARSEMSILPSVMIASRQGRLWLKSHKFGVYSYTPATGEVAPVTQDELPISTQASRITAATLSHDGTLYLGFRNAGFDIISPNSIKIRSKIYPSLQQHTQGRSVSHLAASGNMIWGGIDDAIFRYDVSSDTYAEIPLDKIFDDSPYFRQQLKDIKTLPGGHLTLVTDVRYAFCHYDGVKLVRDSLFKSGILTGQCIADHHGTFITASNGNLLCHLPKQKEMAIKIAVPSYNQSAQLLGLSRNALWVLCENTDLLAIDVSNRKVKGYPISKPFRWSDAVVTCAVQDKKGNIYIGTSNNGLLTLTPRDNTLRGAHAPYLGKNISNLHLLADGRLYLTANDKLCLYNPATGRCIYYHSPSFGSDFAHINANALTCIGKDKVAIGTTEGCRIISLPHIDRFTDSISIAKIEVTTTAETRYAVEDFDKGIVLHHNQNDLTLQFRTRYINNPLQYFYTYKLQGDRSPWKTLESGHTLSFPNLPPGHYTLCIRSSAGKDSHEYRLSIRILPSPWASWQAIGIYTILLLLALYYVNRMYLRRRTNTLELLAKEQEAQRERQTNEMNMQFFANVSHEFRNPLTMIAGPLMSIRREPGLSQKTKHSLQMMSLNVNRMLQLIDQMLDFNKLENDVLKLQVTYNDLSARLLSLVGLLRESAQLHSIQVTSKGLDNPILMWIDLDKLDKIIGNLFTNALKHTPDGGRIGVDCQETEDRKLSITVSNNGKNIPEAKLQSVFLRYYQVKEVNSDHRYGFGSGIGLYYASQQVKLHHGTISVHNLAEGGVSFTVMLPLDDVYSPEEKAKTPAPTIPPPLTEHITDEGYDQPDKDLLGQRPNMLVIDDDTQLSLYVRSLFTDTFNVKNLYSAEAALEYLKDHTTDIILSDVMMDEMSGLELCRTLKQDVSYSHIPIILISGKSNISEQIEGLKVGAVGYIVKPFDPDMLRALVTSQLQNMEEVRHQLSESASPKTMTDKLSPQDKLFIDQLYQIMEHDMAKEEINITAVCDEMHVSRTKFNYKMKALTGMTPSSFFRTYKLNHAARLLRSGECNVSEAALHTGFLNISYFSTVFKKQFGVSPSEYK